MAIDQIKACISCGIREKIFRTDVIRSDERTNIAFIKYPADCQICHL